MRLVGFPSPIPMEITMDFALTSALIAQSNSGGGIGGLIFLVVYLAVVVGVIAGFWKTYAKAGQPGWACIVPFYNIYIWCKIVGRPGWWLLLMFIPLVNFVTLIILSIDLAKSFGKGTGFGLGIAFLGFIFIPILGFGDAQYQGPAAG